MSSPATTGHPPCNVPAAQAKPPVEATTPRIDSRTWFAHHRVIEIDHHGTIYRLRCTSQGKLILTK